MTTPNPRPAAPSAKDRILTAAFRRFAAHSYHETHLRDIAADAGVDVAYVHRSFGSKEKLFQAVLAEASRSHGVAEVPLEDIAPLLTRHIFSDQEGSGPNDPDNLMILIRSLLDPVASGPVGARLEELYIEPLRQKLGDDDGLRAASIMSLLIGVRIMHLFLKLPSVTPQDTDRATEQILRAVQAIIASDATGKDPKADL
ncbi:TetR/AcrR family transcriptional regulator [Paracoccus yeei]|nr:TetR/AcrR family transcriptional regulator [Paracoccus yeei]